MNPIVFLRVIAAILLIFGALYLFSPITLSAKAGISSTASGLTDIRATYGGFQIGFALFLFWCCMSTPRLPSALVATALVFGSVGAARLFGVIADGELSGFNLIGLSFEVVLTAVALYFINQTKKNPA